MFGRVYHLHKNNAQLITWSFLMIQLVSFTSAAFEAFAEAYLCFLVSTSAKKSWGNWILRNLKKYVSKSKTYLCLKRKSNVSLNKKVVTVFHTIFKLDFITQINYCIIHRCLCSLFILLLFSFISFQETEQRNNVNLSLFIQLAKVQQQN